MGAGDSGPNGDGGPGIGLSVLIVGDGGGTVRSQPAGIDCPGICAASFAQGTPVVLTATPVPTSHFAGWSQAGCVGTQACAIDLLSDQETTARFDGARNRIFVTSRSEPAGSLGGVAGADQICAMLAAQVALDGTFIALLSDSGLTAAERLAGSRGWIRVDGMPVADTADDLLNGHLYYPVHLDETGARVASAERATTGTRAGGTLGPFTCGDYTDPAASPSTSGLAHSGTSNFLDGTRTSCDLPAHLYCLETTYNTAVAPVPQDGPVAFAAVFAPTMGLTGADGRCGAEARAADLPGTFTAFLSTGTVTAASRIATVSGGWVRPDGVPVAAQPSDLLGGRLIAPIAKDATGALSTVNSAWGGASTPNEVGTVNCADWTTASSSSFGSTGSITADDEFFYARRSDSCNQSMAVYCLQTGP